MPSRRRSAILNSNSRTAGRETGAYVDAAGRPTEVDSGPGRAVTPIVRGETPIAVLVHDERLLDQFGLVEEVLTAARLAVENEQLQAEVRARLEELRASRARIVETGDAERRAASSVTSTTALSSACWLSPTTCA